jgi:hypothetical protein
MKNTFKISALAVLVVAVFAGCETTKYLVDDNNNISGDARVCKRLKRQMNYNDRSPNMDAKYIAKSQTDRLKQLYNEYDCNNVLAGKPAKIAEVQPLS